MQPFIKWVGGKRQLISAIRERLPKEIKTYYEPFIGGGALLFDLSPSKAVIGDINTILIDSYIQLKKEPFKLISLLESYTKMHNEAEDKKIFYLSMREEYNNHIKNNDYSLDTVALFIYLNKTCFNGLYRVNSKGLFNVPFNNKETVNLYNYENIVEISEYLKNVEIMNCDFEQTCSKAQKGDFVFFDSPYAPLKSDSFEAYTKEGFSVDEHKRLAKLFRDLTEKGVNCMLTNHNTDFIQDLYKEYNIEVVQVKRMINSDSSNRKGEELIIRNY